MSSLPVASQLEILDLRQFSARQLRPLLEKEAEKWRDRLRWDYSTSTELLLQYLESRILDGFVALDQGRVVGYTFCVYEGRKAVIGDAFACDHRTMTDADTTRALLVHVLEMLRHLPTVDRVESQLLMFDAGEFADVFAGPAFAVYPRLFLECELRGRPALASRPLADELEFVPWHPMHYQAAGELIHASYVGHCDAKINDQYRTVPGSLRFLHNIVRFPGCGVFQAAFSWLLRKRRSGALVGMVLCSRVAPEVGHITQLCIAPAYRGRGLANALMNKSAESLVGGGFEAISLTVTEANDAAARLYERFGFRMKHRFDAMTLDTRYRAR
jgi:ribosomal protein S18 acetylase RimI-like enzyme